MSFIDTAKGLNADIVARFRSALETGKWPDGKPLSAEQKHTVMEAVLAWEAANLPPEQRIGYIPRNECQSTQPDIIPMVTRHDA